MEKKEIIAYLNAETEYSNVVLEQSVEYEQKGIDGLYIYNYDDDRKVQADFIATMKLIIKRVDIPVYIGVAVKKKRDNRGDVWLSGRAADCRGRKPACQRIQKKKWSLQSDSN